MSNNESAKSQSHRIVVFEIFLGQIFKISKVGCFEVNNSISYMAIGFAVEN